MDQDEVQQLRAEVIARKNLPTMPTVLARILQLVEGESANGRELIDVIEHDQALTAKMLRLANSAFFGQSRRVATIPRAVVLLGFSTVRNLALAIKVWDSLGKPLFQASEAIDSELAGSSRLFDHICVVYEMDLGVDAFEQKVPAPVPFVLGMQEDTSLDHFQLSNILDLER